MTEIIALGGGGFSMEDSPALDLYITKSMLALWREWEVDRLLRRAGKEAIILAGVN